VWLCGGVDREPGVSRTPSGWDDEPVGDLQSASGTLRPDRPAQGDGVHGLGDSDDDEVDEVLLAAGRSALLVGDRGADLIGDLVGDEIEPEGVSGQPR